LQHAQSFLARIGKEQAYEQAKPNVPTPHPLNYMLLFRGSLSFVEGDGAKYADPPSRMSRPQCFSPTLTARAQY